MSPINLLGRELLVAMKNLIPWHITNSKSTVEQRKID